MLAPATPPPPIELCVNASRDRSDHVCHSVNSARNRPAFIDDEVRGQHARSRAAVVLRALERERRRRLAERDAVILAATASAPTEMDALAGRSARTILDID